MTPAPHHITAREYVDLLEAMPSAYCEKCSMILSGTKFKQTSPEHVDNEGSWIRVAVECDNCAAPNFYRIIKRNPRVTSVEKEWVGRE